MNSKNELQMYCQRHHQPLPTYCCLRNDHGQWVSTVSFCDLTGQNHVYTGAACSKKTNADIMAAEQAVHDGFGPDAVRINVDIPQTQAHTLLDNIELSPMYVLIDYENINKLDMLHNVFRNSNGQASCIYKFVGYSHHSADTEYPSHIVHSPGKDSVDHYISIFIGMLMGLYGMKSEMTILVLTKDLFAAHYTGFIKGIDNVKIHHIPSETACVSFLNNAGYYATDSRYNYQTRKIW